MDIKDQDVYVFQHVPGRFLSVSEQTVDGNPGSGVCRVFHILPVGIIAEQAVFRAKKGGYLVAVLKHEIDVLVKLRAYACVVGNQAYLLVYVRPVLDHDF